MRKAYFVSDIHLTKMAEEKAQVLLRFLRFLNENPKDVGLFFVGDIFDLWLGDHSYFVQEYEPIVSEVRRFIQGGGHFHYFEGNHDLHLSPFWRDDLCGSVHAGPKQFEIQGKQVRVEHGDEMNPDDTGYLFLRWFLRIWPIRFLILFLPGLIVAWFGDRASRLSRNYTHGLKSSEQIKKIIHTHVKKMAAYYNFDFIISGHVHVRDEFEFETNQAHTSYNLGSWDESSKALLIKDGQCEWLELS